MASEANGLLTDEGSLTARWGRAPGVSFAQVFGGTVAVLENASSRAIVALQGAQVLSWQKAGDAADVLWLSPLAQLGTSKAVRGGIPICWPWFGPHPSDAGKPAHGIVRASPWRVTGSAASEKYARLVLAFETGGASSDAWPHRAKAEVEITAGETLTVALSTDNLGKAPFAVTEALHTYLRIGDIGSVTISGLESRTYVDQLQAAKRFQQDSTIRIAAETDRVYLDTPDVVFVRDEALAREISVAKTGSQSTVVWNPWIEKAQRLGDLGDNGYRHMLCVETANAFDNAIPVEPRARHRMSTEISVRSL